MKVLVACEFSGIVRDAFTELGHDATSCDLIETERDGKHVVGDVREILSDGWDLMVAHPPCTYLACSGVQWIEGSWELRMEAIEFVKELMLAPIKKIAIENPVGVLSTYIRKPDQYIQPYWFGHPYPKKTGLWLKGLPKLVATNIVEVTDKEKIHNARAGIDRMKNRSRTPEGIAKAMAEQWSNV